MTENESFDVGRLDYSDLVCCGKPMQLVPNGGGHVCRGCGWAVTQIAFLQNHHGPPGARRARIANREIGYQSQSVRVDAAAA